MLLHGHKIAIVVQQRAAAFNAKRADNDVVRFADRYSHIPETTIVPRGARGEIGVEERHDLEAAQAALDTRRGKLIASALKNFKQNEIANKDRLEGHRSFEFRGRRRQSPRRCAIQTELSTRITTGATGGPAASRRGRLPNPSP
jgi:hypothetical protein